MPTSFAVQNPLATQIKSLTAEGYDFYTSLSRILDNDMRPRSTILEDLEFTAAFEWRRHSQELLVSVARVLIRFVDNISRSIG
jgi:hypothetical protein